MFVTTSITIPQTGLNSGYLFSHSSGVYEFKIKMLTGLVSFEASLFGLQMAAFLCILSWSSLCVVCVLISYSYKETIHIELGSILMAIFTLITYLKVLLPNTVTFSGTGWVRTSTYKLVRATQFSP